MVPLKIQRPKKYLYIVLCQVLQTAYVKRHGSSHLRVPNVVIDKINNLYYSVIRTMISLKNGYYEKWHLSSLSITVQSFTLKFSVDLSNKNHLLSFTSSVDQGSSQGTSRIIWGLCHKI